MTELVLHFNECHISRVLAKETVRAWHNWKTLSMESFLGHQIRCEEVYNVRKVASHEMETSRESEPVARAYICMQRCIRHDKNYTKFYWPCYTGYSNNKPDRLYYMQNCCAKIMVTFIKIHLHMVIDIRNSFMSNSPPGITYFFKGEKME